MPDPGPLVHRRSPLAVEVGSRRVRCFLQQLKGVVMRSLVKFASAVSFLVLSFSVHAQLACTRFYPSGGVGTVGIYNNCNKCMTASMGWCDGTIHRQSLGPNSGTVISTCVGTITLVGENPCSGAASQGTPAAEKAVVSMQPTDKVGISTLVSRQRVTTRQINTAEASGGTCSASNEVGDVCSVSCPVGKAAQCQNAPGAGAPVCVCQ